MKQYFCTVPRIAGEPDHSPNSSFPGSGKWAPDLPELFLFMNSNLIVDLCKGKETGGFKMMMSLPYNLFVKKYLKNFKNL